MDASRFDANSYIVQLLVARVGTGCALFPHGHWTILKGDQNMGIGGGLNFESYQSKTVVKKCHVISLIR